MEDLKPCPFCGGTDIKLADSGVWCMNTACEGGIDFGHFIGSTKEESMACQKAVSEAWNTRTDSDEVKHKQESIHVLGFMLAQEKAEVARLREALGEANRLASHLLAKYAVSEKSALRLRPCSGADHFNGMVRGLDAEVLEFSYKIAENRQLLNSKGPADNT